MKTSCAIELSPNRVLFSARRTVSPLLIAITGTLFFTFAHGQDSPVVLGERAQAVQPRPKDATWKYTAESTLNKWRRDGDVGSLYIVNHLMRGLDLIKKPDGRYNFERLPELKDFLVKESVLFTREFERDYAASARGEIRDENYGPYRDQKNADRARTAQRGLVDFLLIFSHGVNLSVHRLDTIVHGWFFELQSNNLISVKNQGIWFSMIYARKWRKVRQKTLKISSFSIRARPRRRRIES